MSAPRITVGARVLVSNGLRHRSFRTSAPIGEYLVISAPYDWPPDDEPENSHMVVDAIALDGFASGDGAPSAIIESWSKVSAYTIAVTDCAVVIAPNYAEAVEVREPQPVAMATRAVTQADMNALAEARWDDRLRDIDRGCDE